MKHHKYGVLHVHDLQKTLKEKGIDFPHRLRILEVCNPVRASRVLTIHMAVNLALPCPTSVFEEGGKVKIGMIKPSFLLSVFPGWEKMKREADEVEQDTIRIIEDAR